MAASPWRVTWAVLLIALNVWIWALAGVVWTIRWHSIDRPGPLVYDAFPYGEIRIGVDASYPPFAVATADDLYGVDIDLGNALAEKLGIPVRFVNMGYDGLYDSIRADQVDMVISALLVDPAKRGEVRYTRAYYNSGLVLVTPEASPIQSMQDIGGERLAYEFGGSADAEVKQWQRRVEDFRPMPYELPEYALDAVRLGEADAALVDATSYRLYRRDHPDWPAQHAEVTFKPYAIAIRIDRFEAWQLINRALRELEASGELDAILDRWL